MKGKEPLGAVTQGEELLDLMLCVWFARGDETAAKQTGEGERPPERPWGCSAACALLPPRGEKIDELNNAILWQ